MQRLLCFLLLAAAMTANATVFTAQDGHFTMDLPSGWTAISKPPKDSVLAVTKGNARIDIKALPDCHDADCVEKKTLADLQDVKKRKMQVTSNAYTGEEIKRIDFSTGDPFFYINFFTPKNDFSAGYFLIGKNAYSILAKDLSYAQTDLIFSFISPISSQTAPDDVEIDFSNERSYDIEALPVIAEQDLLAEAPIIDVPAPAAKLTSKRSIRRLRSFVSPNMPPYVLHLGRGFDALVLLLLAYALLQLGALAIRCFIRPKTLPQQQAAPLPYPLHLRRLYGTPSLIYRAQDSQGQIWISLTSRWDSLFLFGGLLILVAAIFILATAGILEQLGVPGISPFIYQLVYSAISLVLPLGILIFMCGILWAVLAQRQFSVYDKTGKKTVEIIQRGFYLKKECYILHFTRQKEFVLLERKRFALLRHWTLLNKQGELLASVCEQGLLRALAAKVCGHLWGMLRASYQVMDSQKNTGTICSTRSMFNCCNCTFSTLLSSLNARDLMAVALLINIRDRDKWYPWL